MKHWMVAILSAFALGAAGCAYDGFEEGRVEPYQEPARAPNEIITPDPRVIEPGTERGVVRPGEFQ